MKIVLIVMTLATGLTWGAFAFATSCAPPADIVEQIIYTVDGTEVAGATASNDYAERVNLVAMDDSTVQLTVDGVAVAVFVEAAQ